MAGTFSDKIDRDDLAKMPDEYRDILVHQMLANGEGELSAGDTYVDSFYPLAPDADERTKCLKFAMEEIDHYRRFAKLLKQLDIDIGYMVGQQKKERRYFPAESMTTPFTTWEERAAFSFLCELEGHCQINEMAHSTYEPLVPEAAAILKEEAGHFGHGKLLMRRAHDDPETRARAQEALNRFYPMALDMFGRSDSKRAARAVHWGLRRHTNGELRELYQQQIRGHIESLGYDMPPDDPSLRRYH
ncbi:Phenylacetic acid catabolic protein [Streptomyces sp. MST-110588]|uniref:Phenylacetic acid catabolic protein n=1 Tax=Streptomyces sp. MST-110588 TaxID=2833628 RepID=UPI001F5E055E|nr:Phenylacetic acid catabolic protein [Streptomyces sp. MST-110588]UNO38370.1 phenylacetate-CoA oxygenase subunit PaaI [Streptomyces sp. MST-110588]